MNQSNRRNPGNRENLCPVSVMAVQLDSELQAKVKGCLITSQTETASHIGALLDGLARSQTIFR